MHLPLKMTALMAPLLVAAAPAAGPHRQAEPIVIGRPAPPTRQMVRAEGNCGAVRYGITLDYEYEDAARRLRSLTVNGRELPAAARQRILDRLNPGMWIMRANIDQCGGTVPDSGRFRLTVSQRRQRNVETQFFDFWVAPDGSVSDIRFN